VLIGLLQGDPLSCCLFNLFIDDLPRYIESVAALKDIPNLLGLLFQLLFADDYAAILGGSAAAQQVLFHINRWCEAWGLIINDLMGKSNIFRLYRGRSPPADYKLSLTFPTLMGRPEAPRILQAIDKYLYLGSLLTQDLVDYPFAKPSSLSGSFGPFYAILHRSDLLRDLPLSIRNSVLKTYFHIYAESIHRYNDGSYRALQDAQVSAMLATLRLPFKSTLSTLWVCSTMGHPTARGHIARSKYRMFTSMELSPLQSLPERDKPIFLKVYERLSEERKANTLTDDFLRDCSNWRVEGLFPLPTPARVDEVSKHGEALGRAISYEEARRQSLLPEYAPALQAALRVSLNPPLVEGTFKHLIYLGCGFPASKAEMRDVRGPPLCYMGPGCRSLVTECTAQNCKLVLLAQAGAIGMRHSPFSLPPRGSSAPQAPVPLSEANRLLPKCVLCSLARPDSSTVPDSLFHLLCECRELRVVRAGALASLAETLLVILETVDKLNSDVVPELELDQPQQEARADVPRYLTSTACSPDEKLFIFYRLTIGAPWPPSVLVSRPRWYLARAVAETLRHARNSISFGTRLADKWIPWSQSILQEFLNARRASYQGPLITPPSSSPSSSSSSSPYSLGLTA
jgi:hypothetical protein